MSNRAKSCLRENWKFQWARPQADLNVLIKCIVPGPFTRPMLVKAQPYLPRDSCRNCVDSRLRRSRNGIPDPWLEYLNWKQHSSATGPTINKDKKLTNLIWTEKRLALVQGIPDPWKQDSFEQVCKCWKSVERDERASVPKKAAKSCKTSTAARSSKVLKLGEQKFAKLPTLSVSDTRSKDKLLSNFQKLHDSLKEFDAQLKSKAYENKTRRMKDTENITIISHLYSDQKIPVKNTYVDNLEPRKIYGSENGKKKKTEERKVSHSNSKAREKRRFSHCPGKCGDRLFENSLEESSGCGCKGNRRICRIIPSIPSAANDYERATNFKSFLKEIKSRIEITKKALESPHLLSGTEIVVEDFTDASSIRDRRKANDSISNFKTENHNPACSSPGAMEFQAGRSNGVSANDIAKYRC